MLKLTELEITVFYSMAIVGYILRGKRSGHEADHLPPPSVEVRNEWIYNPIPQYTCIA